MTPIVAPVAATCTTEAGCAALGAALGPWLLAGFVLYLILKSDEAPAQAERK